MSSSFVKWCKVDAGSRQGEGVAFGGTYFNCQHSGDMTRRNFALCVTQQRKSTSSWLCSLGPSEAYLFDKHWFEFVSPRGPEGSFGDTQQPRTQHAHSTSRGNSPQALLAVEPVLGLTVLGRKVVQRVQAPFPAISLYVFIAHATQVPPLRVKPALHTEKMQE